MEGRRSKGEAAVSTRRVQTPERGAKGSGRGETGSMYGCVYGDAEKRRMEVFEDYRKEFGLLGLSCVGLADWWACSSSSTRF